MDFRPFLAAAGLLAVTASPALATGTISCVSAEGATLDMTIGTLPILAVVGATIAANGEIWSTADGQIVAGQAFSDEAEIRVDFADPNIVDIMMSLRLFRTAEGDDFAMAGTLRVVGTGAFAVVCEGP